MKTLPSDLALFGASPEFEQKLHVGRPNLGKRSAFLRRINEMLDRRWLSNDGQFVREFESQLSEYLGVKHCIAVCNATVALEITARALGLTGEVIVPSFTFVATAHALQWQEITPVFCDIQPGTHSIDPLKVEDHITPRTSGLLGVHIWGQGCDVEALEQIAARHRLALLFDAAHAFGCTHKGVRIGGFGRAEVFSFHATKFLNTFEGGAIATNDDELAGRLRLMKNFGFAGYDRVIYIGTNGKMNEACAAMGLTGLESVSEFVDVNTRNHAAYRRELDGLPGVRLLGYDPAEKNNHQYVVLEIDEESAGLSRDLLVKILWAENVMARRYFYPGCHRMEPYRSFFPHAHLTLPETERLCQRVMVLPNGTAVAEEDVERTAQIIRLAVGHAAEIQERFHRSAMPVQSAGSSES